MGRSLSTAALYGLVDEVAECLGEPVDSLAHVRRVRLLQDALVGRIKLLVISLMSTRITRRVSTAESARARAGLPSGPGSQYAIAAICVFDYLGQNVSRVLTSPLTRNISCYVGPSDAVLDLSGGTPMSFVTTHPEVMAAAAFDLQSIGSQIAAGNAAVAGRLPRFPRLPTRSRRWRRRSSPPTRRCIRRSVPRPPLSTRCSPPPWEPCAAHMRPLRPLTWPPPHWARFNYRFRDVSPGVQLCAMYAGPGAGPMPAAATAWNGLSADLESTASSYQSVISGLTDGPWLGPASMSMASAPAIYMMLGEHQRSRVCPDRRPDSDVRGRL